ncbi:MAG: hypothetical protein H0X31_24170 [Nostocaceae cyanobacterium]|nr:hypothetical protein [Nostocaceae cyanobacterium]
MEVYEAGKKCALPGGCHEENPFINNDDGLGGYISWVRGFMAHSTPDPACSICKGTGESQVDATLSGYGIVTLKCYCNKPPLKDNGVSSN